MLKWKRPSPIITDICTIVESEATFMIETEYDEGITDTEVILCYNTIIDEEDGYITKLKIENKKWIKGVSKKEGKEEDMFDFICDCINLFYPDAPVNERQEFIEEIADMLYEFMEQNCL